MKDKNRKYKLEDLYQGSASVTQEGKACARWDSMDDRATSAYIFPEGKKAADEKHNHCRNPTSEEGGDDVRPWCFIDINDWDGYEDDYDFCDVPSCDVIPGE